MINIEYKILSKDSSQRLILIKCNFISPELISPQSELSVLTISNVEMIGFNIIKTVVYLD
jgi:hypothetical protein